jgi:hypothetical protein
VCIAFLLVAGTAQTAHFCGFRGPDADDSSQVRVSSAATSLCLVCLMAQTATAAPTFLALFPTLIRSRRVSIPQAREHSFLQAFHLYVRPPPFC